MEIHQRVAILAPGPSLWELWSEEQAQEYSCIYAVNTAGWYFTHHWLCGFDTKVFVPYFEPRACWEKTLGCEPKQPLVGMLTNKPHRDNAVARRWHARMPLAYYGIGITQEQKARAGREKCGFTFPNVVNEVLRCHACPVDIYGMDYAIDRPCIGKVDGDRSRRRFAEEALWLREFWQPERLTVYGEASQQLLEFLCWRREKWP